MYTGIFIHITYLLIEIEKPFGPLGAYIPAELKNDTSVEKKLRNIEMAFQLVYTQNLYW